MMAGRSKAQPSYHHNEIRAHRCFSVILVTVMFISTFLRANDVTNAFARRAYQDDTVPRNHEFRRRKNGETPWLEIDNKDGSFVRRYREHERAMFSMPEEEDWLLESNEPQQHEPIFTIPKLLHKVILTHSGDFPDYFDDIVNATNRGGDDREPPEGTLIHAHLSWRKMNPGYKILYYNLHLARLYLSQYYHPIFLRAFDCIEAFSGKTDLLRSLIVYRDGGFYSDWKQECTVDGLLKWLSSNDTQWFSAFDQPGKSNRMQNAFFGAPPRSPILARAIRISLQKLQSRADLIDKDNGDTGAVFGMGAVVVLGQAFVDVGKQFGWDLPQRRQANQNWDRIPGVRLGEFNYRYNSIQRFFYDGRIIIIHKCRKCGQNQDWDTGNNYHAKFAAGEYFCPDAPSLFHSAKD